MAFGTFMAHPRASTRRQRFIIEPQVRGSQLVAAPLFALGVPIIGAASRRGPVETGTGAAATFGMATSSVSSTMPG
jgi:hypothetical protein